ncbi:MAG: GNAT family N-acetyltransferase [Rhodospirillales bacterium]|nr:GNAT family N-acetyltransferase [Rhodospirillales bacterium]
MGEFPDLFGEKLNLVSLSEDGLEDFFEYSKMIQLYKYFEFGPPETITESKIYLEKLIERSNKDNAKYWFIQLVDIKKIIGTIGVHDIDWRKKIGEVSYGLSPAYWQKGYFNAALRILLDHLFRDLNFHRICATTRQDNQASIRALEKVGFKEEGILRDFYLSDGSRRHNASILSVLSDEYLPATSD